MRGVLPSPELVFFGGGGSVRGVGGGARSVRGVLPFVFFGGGSSVRGVLPLRRALLRVVTVDVRRPLISLSSDDVDDILNQRYQ